MKKKISFSKERKIFLIRRGKALRFPLTARFLLTVSIVCLGLKLAAVPPIYADYLHIIDSGFTTLPISARAIGMGEAFTAIADDYSACYFNPAGLVQIRQKELGTMYVDLYSLGLLKQSFLSFVESNTGMGAGGISWSQLSADLEPEEWNYNLFSYSYAQSLFQDKLIASKKVSGSWGINLKYLKQTTSWGNGGGYGLDIGFLIWGRSISAGINIQELISQIEWDTNPVTKQSIPTNIKLGTAYRLNPRLLLALDMNASWQDFPKDIRLGSEWWVHKNMALRLGIVKIFQKDGLAFSGGLGFYLPTPKKIAGIKAFTFDYALSYDDIGNTHRFSLSFIF